MLTPWVRKLEHVLGLLGSIPASTVFMTLPMDLEEAAKIDDCNPVKIYMYVMMPLSQSGGSLWQRLILTEPFR